MLKMKWENFSLEKEVDFCYHIRPWYEAEDEPGLSAIKRISMWLNLFKALLINKDINFETFLPYGMYTGVMWKHFTKNIRYVYYNTVVCSCPIWWLQSKICVKFIMRAFFGELSDMEPIKLDRMSKVCGHPTVNSTVTELISGRSLWLFLHINIYSKYFYHLLSSFSSFTSEDITILWIACQYLIHCTFGFISTSYLPQHAHLQLSELNCTLCIQVVF